MEMPMDDGLNALLEGAVPLRQNTQIERGKHARSELEGRDSRSLLLSGNPLDGRNFGNLDSCPYPRHPRGGVQVGRLPD